MFQHQATVLWNKKISSGCYKIGLTCSEYYSAAKPGQFIMLGFAGQTDPLAAPPVFDSQSDYIRRKGSGSGVVIQSGGKGPPRCWRSSGPEILLISWAPLGSGVLLFLVRQSAFI